MNKLTIHYNSQGESGNIFWILRSIYEACCREGIAPTVFKEMQERVFASDSYEEALAIIGEEVNLIDDAKDRYAMNHKQWIVFSDSEGNELLKMTVKGSFEQEINSTIGLLAYENNIDPAEICFAFVMTQGE